MPTGSAFIVKCLNCLHIMFFADDDDAGASPIFPKKCPLCDRDTLEVLNKRAEIEVRRP